MTKQPCIADYMVPHPYTIEYFEHLGAAEKLMNAHKIRHLPVVDRNKIYGIISDRDIKLAASIYKGKDYRSNIFVKDICISSPYVVEESEALSVVLDNMAKKRLGSVIVVRDKNVVGIFTTTDACRILSRMIKS